RVEWHAPPSIPWASARHRAVAGLCACGWAFADTMCFMPEFPYPRRRACVAAAGVALGWAVGMPTMAQTGAVEGRSAPRTNPAEALELPTVNVIGTTPLPGVATPIEDVPANVQIYTSKDIGRRKEATLTDFLEQNAGSVSANAAQGNPFQPDIN